MKRIFRVFTIITSLTLLSIATGCSSAPKRAMSVTAVYTSASTLLETANSCIATGDLENAASFLETAYNQAMSIDNSDLLVAVCLTKISLELSLSPADFETAQRYLSLAEDFAKTSSNPKKEFALCGLASIRIEIANGKADSVSVADSGISFLEGSQAAIKGDKYNEAQFMCAKGDLYKLKKAYDKADKEYSQAAKLYTDERYLFEIGIVWYKIAQVRSLNGNKEGALEAIDKAIFYDRAAENSKALGTDYYAMGLILSKNNPTKSELEQAKNAFRHSADIFDSIGYKDLAEKSRNSAE